VIALSVNLNKIALLRNSRSGNFPDILVFARRAIDAGARGITVHPRPDQRHIRAQDIAPLHALVREHPHIEFNIEGNPFCEKSGSFPGFMELVLQARPQQCTLVPDSEQQLTSDHGFDLRKHDAKLANRIVQLKNAGIRVSLFMDADETQMPLAAAIGADRIELYTGPFAACFARDAHSTETRDVFEHHCRAAQAAHQAGLGVNAGHDLNLSNLVLYRSLPHLAEVSIGHALTVDALEYGWGNTITSYVGVLAHAA